MAAEGTQSQKKKNNLGEEQEKKHLPLVQQIPGTPTPTLFKRKIFEGAVTTHRSKNHSTVHPTSRADCRQVGEKVTHRGENNNNLKIIINELLLTIGKKKIPVAYTNETWLLEFLAIINI